MSSLPAKVVDSQELLAPVYSYNNYFSYTDEPAYNQMVILFNSGISRSLSPQLVTTYIYRMAIPTRVASLCGFHRTLKPCSLPFAVSSGVQDCDFVSDA